LGNLLGNFNFLSRRGRAKGRFATLGELETFLSEHAALISQKSLIGYCNVKTMLPLHELLRDRPFYVAYYVARWEAFVAILADIAVVMDEFLAPAAELPAAVRHAALVKCFDAIVRQNAPPTEGETSKPEDLIAALKTRLAEREGKPPLGVARIATVGARRLFKTVPIHARLAKPDQPAVEAGVKFMMVRSCGGLAEKFDREALAAAILAAAD